MKITGLIRPVLRSVMQPVWRLTRGQTLGVRAILVNDREQVLLVRHTYVPGWTFPGGGVERSETLEAALAREIREEVGLNVTGVPDLLGIYANFAVFPGDHVAVYVSREFHGSLRRSMEIAEAGFFDRDGLPEGTSAGASRRLDELFGDADQDVMW